MRLLFFDTSLAGPGAAVIDFKRGKPHYIASSSVKTTAKEPIVQRAQAVYAWAHLFIREHRPFDVIGREDFKGRSSKQNHPVHSAWASVDRALNDYGYACNELVAQSSMKKHVVGRGNKVEKDEIAAAVAHLIDLPDYVHFGGRGGRPYDESDAIGLALAWLIREGVWTP